MNPRLRRPGRRTLQEFLEEQRRLAFSYPEVGATRTRLPQGYDHDRNRVLLGHGTSAFELARAALRAWGMFPRCWARVGPPGVPIQEGETVVASFHVGGLWWLAACRIVYVFEEAGPVRRSGFAYGTLPGHLERGEERFSVERHGDGSVWYELCAFSRPRHPLARLGYPLVRRLQRRFVRESQAAMRAAADGVAAGEASA